MENYQTSYLALLKNCKDEYANKYGITRIGILGSVARGEHTENSYGVICVLRFVPHVGRNIGCTCRCRANAQKYESSIKKTNRKRSNLCVTNR